MTNPTSARFLEVLAAVAELETRVVAVARLVAQVLDDGVHGGLLHHARGISPRAAELRLAAAAGLGHADPEARERAHEDGRDFTPKRAHRDDVVGLGTNCGSRVRRSPGSGVGGARSFRGERDRGGARTKPPRSSGTKWRLLGEHARI